MGTESIGEGIKKGLFIPQKLFSYFGIEETADVIFKKGTLKGFPDFDLTLDETKDRSALCIKGIIYIASRPFLLTVARVNVWVVRISQEPDKLAISCVLTEHFNPASLAADIIMSLMTEALTYTQELKREFPGLLETK